MVNITMRKVIENCNLVSGLDQMTKENQVPIDYDDKDDHGDNDNLGHHDDESYQKKTFKRHGFLCRNKPFKILLLGNKKAPTNYAGVNPTPSQSEKCSLDFFL